jgi:uncharacterized Zn-finger protein
MPMPRKGQIEGSPSGISSPKTVPSTSRSGWRPKESSPSLSLHPFQFLQHYPLVLEGQGQEMSSETRDAYITEYERSAPRRHA